MSRRKAGIQSDRIAIVSPRLLGLAHHHLSNSDKEVGPRIMLIDQQRFAPKRLGNPQSRCIALLYPDIPEMPPGEVYAGFA